MNFHAARRTPQAAGYFLVSIHREENVDNPETLTKILTILNRIAEQYNLPVIVSTHPRTRKRLESPHSAHPLTAGTFLTDEALAKSVAKAGRSAQSTGKEGMLSAAKSCN